MTAESLRASRPTRRRTRTVPGAGLALAVFGTLLIVGIWLTVFERVRTERTEALDSTISNSANLALALEVQTNQRIGNLDRFLLLMRHQYEHAPPRVPLTELVAPAFADLANITLISVIDEDGTPLEALINPAVSNAADWPSFVAHRQNTNRGLRVGQPVLGRASGKWVITLTRRIDKPDGSFGGIVVISVEPSYLTSLFERAALGPLDVMSQVLENGVTLARRRGATTSFGEDLAQAQLMKDTPETRSAATSVRAASTVTCGCSATVVSPTIR